MRNLSKSLLRRLGVILGASFVVPGLLGMMLLDGGETGEVYGACVLMMSLGAVLVFFGLTDERFAALKTPAYATKTAIAWGGILMFLPYVFRHDLASTNIAFAAASVLAGLLLVWLGIAALRIPLEGN
jgi:small neutral amino acid transporter SnatA (MarC family)